MHRGFAPLQVLNGLLDPLDSQGIKGLFEKFTVMLDSLVES
jgi:hypothetical protein